MTGRPHDPDAAQCCVAQALREGRAPIELLRQDMVGDVELVARKYSKAR